MDDFLDFISRGCVSKRMKALKVHTVDSMLMLDILSHLRGKVQYPRLQSLSLASPNDRYSYVSNYPNFEACAVPAWCKIEHLSLQHARLGRLPFYFLPNLSKLEMIYPDNSAHAFALFMVELCEILSITTRLEELSLTATNPHPASRNGPSAKVLLTRLHTIRWSFHVRFFDDVAQLMSRLDTPALRTLDISFLHPDVPQSGLGSLHPITYLGALPPTLIFMNSPLLNLSPQLPFPISGSYPQVKTLSLKWSPFVEQSSALLRQFAFPNLTSLHLRANGSLLDTPGTPPFHGSTSRLETIFKDPYFPHLECLTLSHFTLDNGEDFGRDMLRWMPALKKILFVECTGMQGVAKALHGISVEET